MKYAIVLGALFIPHAACAMTDAEYDEVLKLENTVGDKCAEDCVAEYKKIGVTVTVDEYIDLKV